MRRIYSVTALIIAFVTPASAQGPKIVVDEFMVQSEPGIEIYVRNKRPAEISAFRPERTLLFVHGSTYPASTSFDLKLADTSWMEYVATRGYDVYLLDLRGYGRSVDDFHYIERDPRIGIGRLREQQIGAGAVDQ